jgi:hypothetical protein
MAGDDLHTKMDSMVRDKRTVAARI